jgi:POT family proton-dependent oligopeptide transporter
MSNGRRLSEDSAIEVATTAADTSPRPAIPPGSFFGHPRGLATLSFTEMWERFSYYGLRPLLILFMTATVANGGYGFDRPQASAIVGIYAAFVYLMSLPGGWVADRLLGLRRAIFLGACLISAGHIAIGVSGLVSQESSRPPFFLGLILIVLGTGLLKPNISAIVGDLYPEGGARRDAGFSIFYGLFNLGGLLGQVVSGYLGERVEWHVGMGAAGVAMLIGLFIYGFGARPTLGEIGMEPSRHPDPAVQAQRQRRGVLLAVGFLALIAVLYLLGVTGAVHYVPQRIAQSMTVAELVLAIAFFAWVFAFGGLDGNEKKRIVVVAVLFVFAAVFWSAFEQAPTSLNLFAKDFTERHVLGWEVPATWFQSINNVLVITLAPLVGWLWLALGKRGRNPSSPAKFTAGLLCGAIGFLLMIWAAQQVVAGNGLVKVSAWWLIGSYFFQSVGELCLSPVGLSSMTKLAPRKYLGQMMGIWFLALSLGNVIAGLVGGSVDPEKLEEMPKLFTMTTVSLFVATLVLAALVIPIRRMMQEQVAAVS